MKQLMNGNSAAAEAAVAIAIIINNAGVPVVG